MASTAPTHDPHHDDCYGLDYTFTYKLIMNRLTTMTTVQHKISLEVKLADLQKRLASVTKDITKTLSSDFAEQAVERENDDVLEEISRETQLTIAHLKDALRRIEDGNYGACGDCGKGIALQRLEAIPEATQCVDCAS
jgi:DnaK suppressor protein